MQRLVKYVQQNFNEIFGCTLAEKFRLAKNAGTDKIYKDFYYSWILARYQKGGLN